MMWLAFLLLAIALVVYACMTRKWFLLVGTALFLWLAIASFAAGK
jgi:hypothetical protein